MNNIGLIGFGRFGQVLAQLLSADFHIKVYDHKPNHHIDYVEWVDLNTLLQVKQIFIAVPIRYFAEVIKHIATQLTPETTIIDVCSVKIYPIQIMQQHLPAHVDIIATHPLFGPDSIKHPNHLKMMMHSVRDQYQRYSHWKHYFAKQDIQILEMTPAEHDHDAAFSQGITHLLGRALKQAGFKHTSIDTLGFEQLMKVMTLTCNDTWELFIDLQKYNPYSKKMLETLQAAIEQVKNNSQLF